MSGGCNHNYLPSEPAVLVTRKISLVDLHYHLGHLNKEQILQMYNNGTLRFQNIELIDPGAVINCEDCSRSKIKQSSVPSVSNRRTGIPFHTGSVDLYGPVAIPSVGGAQYGLMYICNETSYGFVSFLKTKEADELQQNITKWNLTINDIGYEMKKVQFDADSIFESRKMNEYLNKIGVLSQYAPSGSHQSNGLVERMIQTVVGMARTMLLASGLPEKFWAYSMDYAMFIYNRTVKGRFRSEYGNMKYVSPYERVTGIQPIFDFPIFGAKIVARHPAPSNLKHFEHKR